MFFLNVFNMISPVSQNFAVVQQYTTKAVVSSNIFSLSICIIGAFNFWKDIETTATQQN